MHLEQLIAFVVAAVMIVGLVTQFAGRLGVAAPLVLVLAGIGVGLVPGVPHVELEPEVILVVVLPPLLYAAALQVPFVDFRRNVRVIAFLSVVLVAVSALAVGLTVHALWPTVGLALAIGLGAVVAPPDAVAAISLGKRLGLPPRIVTILEGEGLVNDATALVLLSTAVAAATTAQAVSVGSVATTFLWAIVGAVVAGWLVGRLAVWVRSAVADLVLDTAVSLVVPFVAFLLGEAVRASGVVAVVTAGIVVGNKGVSRIRAEYRRSERSTWATFTMLVENGVFLLMGFLLPDAVRAVAAEGYLTSAVGMGVLVTAVLIALRFAVIPVLLWSMRQQARSRERRQGVEERRMGRADERFGAIEDERIQSRLARFRLRVTRSQHDVTAMRDQELGWREGAVLGLAGMRGVVTIAAAQTLPEHPLRPALLLVAFVVAIVTLLAQGFALPGVVRALHLTADRDQAERQQLGQLMGRLHEAGRAAAEAASGEGSGVDPRVRAALLQQLDERSQRAAQLAAGARDEELVADWRTVHDAQAEAERAALREVRASGEFSSEAIAWAQQLLDDTEIRLDARAR